MHVTGGRQVAEESLAYGWLAHAAPGLHCTLRKGPPTLDALAARPVEAEPTKGLV